VQAGLLVESVDPASPAEAAGVRPYDVVTALDGVATPDLSTADALLRDFRPGDTLVLTLIREGEEQTATLTLQ
jgi:S1-C subfamily serine protease